MAFWVSFDHLGKLLLANLLCAFIVLVPVVLAHAAFMTGESSIVLFVSLPLLIVALLISFPLAQAGLVFMTRELIEHRDGEFVLFFRGMRLYALKMIGVVSFYLAAVLCLCASIFFYGYRIGKWAPLMGYSLSALALWLLLFVIMSFVFAAPAVVYKNSGVLGAIKLSSILLLDNPLFAVGLFMNMLLFIGLSLMPPVLLLFSFAPLVVLQCSAYEILSRKYRAVQANGAPGSAKVKVADIDFGDDDDEYLCRGLRDLLFPWKN